MSLLDNASLLLTPNAYKEGKLYSVIPSNGNGDFTATRATTATRVNSAGLVDLVPYNLLTWSEMFTDASWSKNSVSISSNVATAPNGTLTADKLIEDTANTNHWTFQTYTGISQSLTASCYFKKSEREWAFIRIRTTSGDRYAYFNLNTGTLGTIESPLTATITSADNGWYRCSVTTTIPNPSTNPIVLGLTTADNIRSYTGDGTSGIFIWGAQLVEGTSARDYLRTETRLNIPRVDYSLGGCPNILLEPQRTNLALQSSSFDNATWTKSATTITANTITSPSGVVDADTLAGDGTISAKALVQTGTATLTSGVTYTTSIYAKKNTNNFIQIVGSTAPYVTANVFANFDLNSGVVGSVGASVTATITNVGNGWYRCTMTAAAAATSNTNTFIVQLVSSSTAVRGEINTLNTSVFLWGAQLEAGAYATSYIPTTTASVTRNADSITRNNIFTNGLITAAGGTWFVELRNNVAKVRDSAGGFYFGVNANTCFRIRNIGSTLSRVSIDKNIAGVSSNLFTTTTDIVKLAIKWNGSTADVFVNGVKVVTATAFAFTALEELTSSAGIPLYINETDLFPTPLTDAQCLALTA